MERHTTLLNKMLAALMITVLFLSQGNIGVFAAEIATEAENREAVMEMAELPAELQEEEVKEEALEEAKEEIKEEALAEAEKKEELPAEEKKEEAVPAVETLTSKTVKVTFGHAVKSETEDTYIGIILPSTTSKATTWKVSKNQTKTLKASTINGYVSKKTVTIGNKEYTFTNQWMDDAGNIYSGDIKIACSQYFEGAYIGQAEIELNLYPIYSVESTLPDEITFTYSGILSALRADSPYSISSQKVKGWSVSLNGGQLSNFGGADYSYTDGLAQYTFLNVLTTATGSPVIWDSVEGRDSEIVTKVSYSGKGTAALTFRDGHTETRTGITEIALSPVYSVRYGFILNYKYVDKISTASGSWSNQGSFSSYSHIMKQPEAQDHYLFLYWENAENGERVNAGETITDSGEGLEGGETRNVTYNAVYQPSLTVVFHEDGKTTEVEAYESIRISDFEKNANDLAFIGWFTADGEEVSDKEYDLPEITSEPVEQTVIHVYARYAATITADSKSKTYGEKDAELTAKVSGIAAEDTVSYSLVRKSGENAGSYEIRIEDVAASTYEDGTQKYEISLNNGKYVINAKEEVLPAPVVIDPEITPTSRPEAEETEDEPAEIETLVVIDPDDTPTTNVIAEPALPAAVPAASWALLNLISTLLTAIFGLGMILTYFRRKEDEKEENEEQEENNRRASKFFGMIPAIASVLVFLFTEDMRNRMVMVDRWTLLMVVLLAVNMLAAYFTRNKDDEEEEAEEA